MVLTKTVHQEIRYIQTQEAEKLRRTLLEVSWLVTAYYSPILPTNHNRKLSASPSFPPAVLGPASQPSRARLAPTRSWSGGSTTYSQGYYICTCSPPSCCGPTWVTSPASWWFSASVTVMVTRTLLERESCLSAVRYWGWVAGSDNYCAIPGTIRRQIERWGGKQSG